MESSGSESAVAEPEKSAYLLIGHGRENPPLVEKRTTSIFPLTRDTVPKGCTLVVKAGPCEPTYTNFRFFIRDPNYEKYLDPVKHIDQIIKRYGPVAVFQEGDIYPNFEYSLIAFNKFDGDKRTMMSSGMIKYPFYYDWETFREFEDIKGSDKAIEVLPKYFEHSIYPLKDAVIGEIERMAAIQGLRPDQLPVDLFISLSKKYSTVFRVSQKKLFDMVRDGTLLPGAFYHFACRSMKPVKKEMIGRNVTGQKMILPERRLNLFRTVNNPKRLAHLEELAASRSRQSLRGSLLEPILREKLHEAYTPNGNSNTRRVLKQQIEEAHMLRRPFVKRFYNNKAIGGRRTKKQKKNKY
jgi:hypothetical protein